MEKFTFTTRQSKMKLVLLAILVMICNISFGQLLKWNTAGNLGTETFKPSIYNDPNLTASNLTLGVGIMASANANRFGGDNWFDIGNNAITGNTLPDAVAGSNYIEFMVTPNSGFSFTPTSFVFNWDKSATGPNSIALRSSVDGFTANLGTVAPYPGTIASINTIVIMGLTNLTTTTFRVYGYGATSTSGTGGFDVNNSGLVNVQLNGTTGPEINIIQGVSGSTYNFGTQIPGSSTDIIFTIENLGGQPLTLGVATITGNPPYSLLANYISPVTSYTGTTTFTIRFASLGTGTFTGSISIPNNDVSGSENPYVLNFTGISAFPAPEINLRGIVGSNPTIFSGDVTPSGTDNTQFASQSVGNSQTKTFRIENIGTADLNVSTITLSGANPADFSILAATPYTISSPSGTVDFTITFAPTTSGIRKAIVSIANDDATGGENPYTFAIEGTGNCTLTANTTTPSSGSVGTEVTITATANNLTGATATLNGVTLPVTQISATQIKVIVPAGAVSGNLVTTNASGCIGSNSFAVINNLIGSCQGGSASSDLFFSEVTDSTIGGLTYVEIYNGTGHPVNLSNYALKTFYNGGAAAISTINLNNVTLISGGIYVVAVGVVVAPDNTNSCTGVNGGNGQLANQVSFAGGINFDVGGNDYIALYNKTTALTIDAFGTYLSATWADALGLGDRGGVFRRKNTAVLPATTFNSSDWNITNWPGTGFASCPTNDYSNIGLYTFNVALPPTITTQPLYSPSCKGTSLTVAGGEGFAGGNPLAYQWYAVAPNVAAWTPLTNAGIYSGVTTATLTISNLAGLDQYQFYCQVRESGANCYSASNTVKINQAQTVTWNGASWTPNSPTISSIAIINGDYNTATNGSFEACNLIVNAAKKLTISAAQYVSIQNDLTVTATGTLTIQNQGSLVMIDDAGVVTNNGTTQVQRTTTPFQKYDYTYWSSPVVSNTIGNAFSLWRTDYSFSFDTANFADLNNDTFDDAAPFAWTSTGTAATMVPGKGYAIMAPTTGPFPDTSTVTFSGAVNNGIIAVPLALSANLADPNDDFNLIGNPYPCSISATDFINNNLNFSGTIYFWTHIGDISAVNPGPNTQNFISNDYAMFNLTGGTKASLTGSPLPNGFIGSGQGFMVEAATATNVRFNNAMRNKTNSNTQFFRSSNPNPGQLGPKDRLWLNLQNTVGMFSQQLVGYFNEATFGFDRGYDGLAKPNGNYISFYSLIENEKYRIQGRPSFDQNDQVPLGYQAVASGSCSISIDRKEGVFNKEATNIYLEDKLLNVMHDLKQGPYVFFTEIGTFDHRFVLRYTNSLATAAFQSIKNSVVVAIKANQITVKSYQNEINEIAVFDILGRIIFDAKDINDNSFTIDKMASAGQALIVEVNLENGQIVSRKVIF